MADVKVKDCVRNISGIFSARVQGHLANIRQVLQKSENAPLSSCFDGWPSSFNSSGDLRFSKRQKASGGI